MYQLNIGEFIALQKYQCKQQTIRNKFIKFRIWTMKYITNEWEK